jgi:hypothetical protein
VASLPNVPTSLEQGVNFDRVGGWYAFLAPAKLPPEIAAPVSPGRPDPMSNIAAHEAYRRGG